jgi:hypothetical protein
MTHCIICGKRLWFESWRNLNKYAWRHQIDTQPFKPVAYLYKVPTDGVIRHYVSSQRPRTQDLWYHIKCIMKHGKPSNNVLEDEWKMG